MKAARFLFPFAILAAAGTAFFVLRPSPAPVGPVAASAPPAELTGLPLKESAKPARDIQRFDPGGVPAPRQPLPPVPELVARADAGDARAACQLAAELYLCREQALLASGQPPKARRPGDAAAGRCDLLFAGHAGRHFGWLRQAAFAGEPEAMLRYAVGEAFGVPGDSYAFLRAADFDTWRREAPALLQTLFEAGYPEVLVYLMLTSDPMFGGQLANLLPPDPARERAYLELLSMMASGGEDAAMLATLLARPVDPAVRDRSRALAAGWRAAYYPGVQLPSEDRAIGHRLPMMQASGQACSQLATEDAP